MRWLARSSLRSAAAPDRPDSFAQRHGGRPRGDAQPWRQRTGFSDRNGRELAECGRAEGSETVARPVTHVVTSAHV
jgi:hypothetical protein